VLMLLKFCSSVVFCVIVRFRVVWFRLCVALVMLIVRFIANGVVLSELECDVCVDEVCFAVVS